MTATLDTPETENLETTRSTTVLRAALHKAQAALTATGQGDTAHALVDARTEVERLTAELATAVRRAEAAEHATARLWANLEHEANRRDWCNEYDEFAVAHGGPSRYISIPWKATVQAVVMATRANDQVTMPEAANAIEGVEQVAAHTQLTLRFDVTGQSDNQRRGRCGCNSREAVRLASLKVQRTGMTLADTVRLISITCGSCTPSAFE